MMPTVPGWFARLVFAFVFGWGHLWRMVLDDVLLLSCIVLVLWKLLGARGRN